MNGVRSDVFVNIQLAEGADQEKPVNKLVDVRNSIAHG